MECWTDRWTQNALKNHNSHISQISLLNTNPGTGTGFHLGSYSHLKSLSYTQKMKVELEKCSSELAKEHHWDFVTKTKNIFHKCFFGGRSNEWKIFCENMRVEHSVCDFTVKPHRQRLLHNDYNRLRKVLEFRSIVPRFQSIVPEFQSCSEQPF